MEWTFEPGHTAAEFCVRHMMLTHVCGDFKNVHGRLRFDPKDAAHSAVSAKIDTRNLWSGDPERDAHLRSADFLDVEKHPEITFTGDQVEVLGGHDYLVMGDLTVHGITRKIPLKVTYLGQWQTPWWEGGVDKCPKNRAGVVATTEIKRHDLGVSWNSPLNRNVIVVGTIVPITIDAEAILSE